MSTLLPSTAPSGPRSPLLGALTDEASLVTLNNTLHLAGPSALIPQSQGCKSNRDTHPQERCQSERKNLKRQLRFNVAQGPPWLPRPSVRPSVSWSVRSPSPTSRDTFHVPSPHPL